MSGPGFVSASPVQAPNIMNNTQQSKLITELHEAWAVANGYRQTSNDLLNASNTQAFNQQASKDSSTVDHGARSTDKQAKPSSNRQASMDPGTSFKHS